MMFNFLVESFSPKNRGECTTELQKPQQFEKRHPGAKRRSAFLFHSLLLSCRFPLFFDIVIQSSNDATGRFMPHSFPFFVLFIFAATLSRNCGSRYINK
jgi:hypothetical protein